MIIQKNKNNEIIDKLNENKEMKKYNRGELKELLIVQIFYQKNSAKNYEIPKEIFTEINIDTYGNCFNCCLSFLYIILKIFI